MQAQAQKQNATLQFIRGATNTVGLITHDDCRRSRKSS